MSQSINRVRFQHSHGTSTGDREVRSRWAMGILLPLAAAALLAVAVPLLF